MKRAPKVALVLSTAATVAFVAAGLPGLAEVPGWFYQPKSGGLGEAWAFLAIAFVVPLLGGSVLYLGRRRQAVATGLVGVVAVSLQGLMIPLDADGRDHVWQRHIGGHGQIFRVAHARRDQPLATLRNYEQLVRQGELGAFLPTKPPGALATYMGMDALARWQPLRNLVEPWAPDARRYPQLEPLRPTIALSMWLMPLTTALAVPLLACFGWILFRDRAAALGGAMLQASAPAVLLITYHLDGALYPLVALGACTAAAAAGRYARPSLSIGAGMLVGLGLYVSFSLLPVVPLVAGSLVLATVGREATWTRPRMWYRIGWHVAALAGGFLVIVAVLREALAFDLATRFTHAMDYHEHWKRGIPTLPWRAWALVEFGLYAGVPLVGASLLRAGGGTRRLIARKPTSADVAALGLWAVLLATSAATGTNEVARLWLPMLPFVALVTATGLRAASRAGRWEYAAAWLAACQLLLALVMKANQPW